MANNFLGGYSPPQQFNQYQQQANNDILAVPVQGEAAVQNYLVAQGRSVLLTDFPNGRIYLKSTSPDGLFSTVRTFEVNEITPTQRQDGNFINRVEFEQFQQTINNQFQQVLNYLKGGNQNESNAVVKQPANVSGAVK